VVVVVSGVSSVESWFVCEIN